ncbi:MAG: MFS transporter [Deltaproteobacteria bacterium]|nr:MFS transporter [Deltaproteobacteria bacterium]
MYDPLTKKPRNREHIAWYMYDFGNSAYASVILLAVYSAYFKGTVVGGAEGSRYWGIAIGIAMLSVAIISPFLGAIADFSASKKRFLFIFSAITWIFTGLLFFVEKGDVFLGMLFFIIAEIGYRSGQVFYNSLLPEIAEPEERGRVSGNGWAVGSLGGILILLILLPLIVMIEGTLIVRLSLVFTALFFAVSAIPAWLWIKERAVANELPEGKTYLSLAYSRLAETFKALGDYRDFLRFIIAFLIYNDGILMAMNFASIIGAVMFGMEQTELIIFMIIVQIFSVIGAYVAGLFGKKIGFKQTLVYSILMMTLVIICMIFAQTILQFYIIGSLAGFALTGVQSVSRTLVSYFAPEGRSAEFYGIFAVTGRTSSFIGPTVYGFLAFEAYKYFENTRGFSTLLAEQAGQRVALGSIVVFLIVGLLVLLGVKDPTRKYLEK